MVAHILILLFGFFLGVIVSDKLKSAVNTEVQTVKTDVKAEGTKIDSKL